MASIIEQVNVGGSTYNIASTAYGEATGNADVATKVVPSSYLNGITATPGVTIHIKFINANTAASPTLTLSGGDTTLNTAIPIVGISTWDAGAVLTLTYDGTNWVRDYEVTIANNLTGSGTSGYLAKFNDTNSITNGPQLGAAVTNQTQNTLFLRSDGVWAKPSYSVDQKIRVYLGNSNSTELPLVGLNSGGSTPAYASHTSSTKDVYGAIPTTVANRATINLGTGAITVPGGVIGNASTATKFSSARTISLSGDISGSASSDGESGWSITNIAIGAGKVTNDMLVNKSVSIAGNTINLGDSITAETLRTSLGLTQALRFVGSTTTEMSDGYQGTPAGISIYTGTDAIAPAVGDVVLDSSNNAEYVCINVTGTTYTWEILGSEGSWALNNDVIHISGAKGDIIYWSNTNAPTHLSIPSSNFEGKVLKLNSSGIPTWGTDNDTKVSQALDSSSTTYLPILFSQSTNSTNTTTVTNTVKRNNSIYVQPSTGTLHATKFSGEVAWSNITGYTANHLYVNTTAGGTNSNVATANDTTYIHLYDNGTKQDTIQFKGAGSVSIAATNAGVITITGTEYTSTGTVNALKGLKLTYTLPGTPNDTTYTDTVGTNSSSPTNLGYVNNAILYIKSIYYETQSVVTSVGAST